MVPLAQTTSTDVEWWWLAVLAGAFTILGVIITLVATWLVARRKNNLDDLRRFEPAVIDIYVELDEFVDTIHNNAGGNPDEEKQIYWDTFRATVRAVTRLELLTSERVYRVARDFQRLMVRFAPGFDSSDYPMAELVERIEELRQVIRKELRIPN
jgi:hypothetical protein